MSENYCNNCNKSGHVYHLCKLPITSIGIIAFRIINNEIKYLTICRKDSFGFIDFIKGNYTITNKFHLQNMFDEMTLNEKTMLRNNSFNELWCNLWNYDILNFMQTF